MKFKKNVYKVIFMLSIFNIFLQKLIAQEIEWQVSDNSVSNKFSYLVEENSEYYHIIIVENNTIVFEDNQNYRKRDRFFISWHQNDDILWVYSGDIGLYYFICENNIWKRYAFADSTMNNTNIPMIMKEAVPRLKKY